MTYNPSYRRIRVGGCLRAEMLAAGHCRESVLPLADLARVRLWVGNALRGLSPARLV